MDEELILECIEEMNNAHANFEKSLATLRAGRVSPAALEEVKVDYYGEKTPVTYIASITNMQSNVLVVKPFDRNDVKSIVAAINEANLGVNPINDGDSIRLVFPTLTEERRRDLVKVAKKYGEEAKVAIRNIRRDANDSFKKLAKEDVSEDEIKALEENASMRQEIATAIKGGMPCLAECGGFMYLHEEMEGMDGNFYEMAGVIPGKVWRTPRLTRFGYITLEQNNTQMTETKFRVLGETDLGHSPAHEFHYFDSENCGNTFHASKPGSSRGWDCIHGTDTMLAGFPHLYYYANPRIPQAFLEKCLEYQEKANK